MAKFSGRWPEYWDRFEGLTDMEAEIQGNTIKNKAENMGKLTFHDLST